MRTARAGARAPRSCACGPDMCTRVRVCWCEHAQRSALRERASSSTTPSTMTSFTRGCSRKSSCSGEGAGAARRQGTTLQAHEPPGCPTRRRRAWCSATLVSMTRYASGVALSLHASRSGPAHEHAPAVNFHGPKRTRCTSAARTAVRRCRERRAAVDVVAQVVLLHDLRTTQWVLQQQCKPQCAAKGNTAHACGAPLEHDLDLFSCSTCACAAWPPPPRRDSGGRGVECRCARRTSRGGALGEWCGLRVRLHGAA